jgi:hypothetical protein
MEGDLGQILFQFLKESPHGWAAYKAARAGGLNDRLTLIAVVRVLAEHEKRLTELLYRQIEEQPVYRLATEREVTKSLPPPPAPPSMHPQEGDSE